jgi:hypothetical protein
MTEPEAMVVCIDANWDKSIHEGINWPVYLGVYTIRGHVIDQVSGIVGIFLREIVNEPRPTAPDGHMAECAWDVSKFRPVRKTDISIFTTMKVPV